MLDLESVTDIPKIKLSYETDILESEACIIEDSRSAYNVLSTIYDNDTVELYEEVKVLYMNHRGQLLWYRDLSRWDYRSVQLDVKLIIAIALITSSSKIIVSHNHPSNQLRPSTQDIAITKKIKAAAKLFDISLDDHIIYTKNGYYSFSDDYNL